MGGEKMKLRKILNWAGLLVVIAVNGLANALPLNGKTTGEISNNIPTLFTPAGYVFSIWTIIYLGLLAFVWYQSRPAQTSADFQDRIGAWFFLSCVFNSAWIVAWHYEQFPLSLLLMLGLLASLLVIYLRLDIGRRAVSAGEKRWVHLPFSIYLGWISVATVANVSVVLYTAGWNGGPLSPEAWTAIMIIVAAILGLAMILTRNEVAYPLVIVWSLVGVAVARSAIPLLVVTAGAGALLLLVVLAVVRLRT
jgi:benzodiazapine receptor